MALRHHQKQLKPRKKVAPMTEMVAATSRTADAPQGVSVIYTEHPDHTIHATFDGNAHELVWHPDPNAATGNVTLDNQTRPMGLHLTDAKFHVQAETFFGVKHEPPAELLAWIQREAASKRCACDGDRILCSAHTANLRDLLAGAS